MEYQKFYKKMKLAQALFAFGGLAVIGALAFAGYIVGGIVISQGFGVFGAAAIGLVAICLMPAALTLVDKAVNAIIFPPSKASNE